MTAAIIEGTTDFIFGPATALFRHCTIYCKDNSFITAANTPKDKRFGFVLMDCNITADPTVTKLYLGRPWRGYAKTVFIRCSLPACIAPEGWNNWDNPANEQTAYYAEYKNTGPGAVAGNRATWSKQLTNREAATYTAENILTRP